MACTVNAKVAKEFFFLKKRSQAHQNVGTYLAIQFIFLLHFILDSVQTVANPSVAFEDSPALKNATILLPLLVCLQRGY